jgi:hypothetical protein
MDFEFFVVSMAGIGFLLAACFFVDKCMMLRREVGKLKKSLIIIKYHIIKENYTSAIDYIDELTGNRQG